MLLLKLSLLPFKLSAKLALYITGGIILAVVFLLTTVNGLLSGLLKLIGTIIILAAVFDAVSMFATIGFNMGALISILITSGAVLLAMYVPDFIQFIFNKVSDISYFLFDAASFRLF